MRAKEKGVITGFEVNHRGEAISHLQFSDDTILFNSARKEEILTLKRILRICQLVSSLKLTFPRVCWLGLGDLRQQRNLWRC